MGEIYIWEWIDSSEAMRWPCDSGFHVPTKTERVNLEDTGISLGAWTDSWWSNFKDYLKIPFAWTRKDSTGNTTTQWSMGWYWSCTAYSSNDISWRVYIGTSSLDTKNLMYRTEGCSIRPFRDKPVAPDSWRTTIYAWTWNAWIFHNSTLWLISISSDWNTRITIADKNVWATTVYNNWDTLSQSNCWNYYQRWNNYWFPRTWAITISSTKADATNYWPWNYYSSSTFITASSSPYNWDSSNNKDLRWWVTGVIKIWNVKEIYVWEWIKSYEAMRWPCPEGFHIPTYTERQTIKTAMGTWWEWNGAGQVMALVTYLKMPLAWYRKYSSSNIFSQSSEWRYWACTSYNDSNGRVIRIQSSSISVSYYNKPNWYSIRPFKDIPAVPDSTWTVEYQWTGDAGIYSNSTLWLISLSTDWTNWITIADKNVWATTVYNFVDALSEANCGKYFQWGNNNWFARTWTLADTSSTQVDTTGYWPWNYYTSSTFITISWDWSNPSNNDLRWWVTGITKFPNVKEVYKWTTKIRPV